MFLESQDCRNSGSGGSEHSRYLCLSKRKEMTHHVGIELRPACLPTNTGSQELHEGGLDSGMSFISDPPGWFLLKSYPSSNTPWRAGCVGSTPVSISAMIPAPLTLNVLWAWERLTTLTAGWFTYPAGTVVP